MKTGRNKPCPCGSGKKYKRCCMTSEELTENKHRLKSQNNNSMNPEKMMDILRESIHDTFKKSKTDVEHKNPIVDPWWEEFMPHYKAKNIDEMLPRLYSFFESHPEEVKNLGLEEEFIYELAPTMDKAGRYDEYIALLNKIYDEFPETYQKAFGALGSAIIEYHVANQKEIDKYLGDFIEKPEKDPDSLSGIVELLAITGRTAELKRLTEAVSVPLIESQEVCNGDFAFRRLTNIWYNPFLAEKDNSECAVLQIMENIKKINLPNIELGEDKIKENITNFIEYKQSFDIYAFNKKNEENDQKVYFDLRWRFAGFLFFEIGCSMSVAHEFSETITSYLYSIVYNKNSKNPFIFNAKSLDNYIAGTFKLFFYIKVIPAIALLQSVIYFYRYLDFLESPVEFDINNVIKESSELKNTIMKSASERKSCIKKIFADFPNFKGKLS